MFHLSERMTRDASDETREITVNAQSNDLVKLPITALVYRTTKAIENPIGDGRHNRADWRPEFDRNRVAAGTLYAIDQADGTLYELSRSCRVIPQTAKSALLRDALLAVSTAPLEAVKEEMTIEAAAEAMGGTNAMLARIVEALGGVEALKQILQPAAPATPSRPANHTTPPG